MNTQTQLKRMRFLWVLCLLWAASLACAAGEQIDSARATAESAINSGRSAVETAQAFATQQAPLLETAKAYATQQGPEMLQTVQAAATQVAFGAKPEDIPVVDLATINGLLTSNVLVSYGTSLSLTDVVDFYKNNMPTNGWSAVSGGRVETDNNAALRFEKSDRLATVTVSLANGKTVVVIAIEGK